MRLVGAGDIGAQPRPRKDLIWVRDVLWIEGAAHQLHCLEIRLSEHVAERLLLLLAHAVFAGDGAAAIHAEVQNAVGEIERNLFLSLNGAIVKNQRMQVTVAGMKYEIGRASCRERV